ncbi:sensor histidine kinase [Fulvivirga lutimaris]|uniref:sensor histidine kinase n=1 Tax=Fulvivirga lutimaris TaxID=1819566 RepID=UPI0012BCBB89|nr:HAMP domain-containing sensor histidine kinase [Fulvivirga lutimaris]MTI39980.1 HAMP domain-containing histidine kinase [Fulvivirga lutimaris]
MTESEINYKNLLSERERDLEDRNEELEAQHEELTAAVEAMIKKNDYLEKTLEELHIRNNEIEQIVYRSSHDLKSPITSLDGLLMLMETDQGNLNDYLLKAKMASNNMKHILQMMVLYSNSLVSDLAFETITINDLWEQVNYELQQIDGYDSVKISFDKNKREFSGDVARLKMILFNLIKNGIDFKNKSNARIEVRFNFRSECLKIQVADNGIGIPNDLQSDIFKMFFRGSNSSKGSGLGLYLSKRAVELMEGKINVVSSENIGTTITVELPLKK